MTTKANIAIFNSVVEISTTPEFQQGQQDFYHNKMDVFVDAEENKLEYTHVYQDYVQLMEQILDATLKKESYGYSGEELDEFYETFKEHQVEYRAINDDVMDLLFGLVDFTQFKSSLLEYKKGCTNRDAREVEDENKEMMAGKQGFELEEFMKEFEVNPDEKTNSWVRKIT